MSAQLILAAINRVQMAAVERIAAGQGLVVFGTMDGGVLEKINIGVTDAAAPVYFYEPG